MNGVDEMICVEDNGVRVRSLNVDATDKIIWDSVINTLSDLFLFKEIFKKDKISETKWDGQTVNERVSIQRKIKKLKRPVKARILKL